MTRTVGEGKNPKITVTLDRVTYVSTGVLKYVFPGVATRSGKVLTVMLVDRAWMYADQRDADRAWALINEAVTVTWRLAYGRRYVTWFDGAAAVKD
jgi:hypothetical protein